MDGSTESVESISILSCLQVENPDGVPKCHVLAITIDSLLVGLVGLSQQLTTKICPSQKVRSKGIGGIVLHGLLEEGQAGIVRGRYRVQSYKHPA